jgi:hypothetical protein
MVKQRASLDLDLDDDILSIASQPSIKPKMNSEQIKEIAHQSGFFSRQPQKSSPAPQQSPENNFTPRRRRNISPYHAQLGIKVRPEIKEIFHTISDLMGIHDCSTFELAILALLEKNNQKKLIEKYNKIVNT